ncbi:serine hydrolase [Maribacter sp. Hel_I_7]|jgi:D-alanyl-D-alanine-carboxypeptidase/D-alanyl-D-alanine-endopeptidase|uniref:serine hydrolase n=1 Tax=Maribacter sp. Hel_I_7 TaxID=1249997 RepID=UPI000479CD51|nr:serine hydrolase [Maribacter sp. Hel_I_7]|tara:strand:- start:54364 stop:55755 length:1392 start_codon:yes stop_codon:yes gene_type:complete
MRKYKIILAFILLAFINYKCQNKSKQLFNKNLPVKVVEAIEKRIEEGLNPSISLALIDSSGVQYFSFGKTADGGMEVNKNTIYEIGSISKVFTAILLAQQVLDEDLKLDDEVNTFLPDSIKLPVMGDTEITFGNLSDHTSGLPRMPANFAPVNPNNPYSDYTVEQMYEFISSYTPIRIVGSEYEYSNLAQGLLGNLLARNKNSTYEELMVETIADPLEMKDTRVELTQKMKNNMALGHSGGHIVENWDISTLAGAGGIRSSTFDMAKFISANLGYIDSELNKSMELTHKVRHHKAGEMSVALAWHIKKGTNGDVVWHNGGTGGYRAFAGFVNESGQGVVLLTNSTNDADDIGLKLLDPESDLADLKFKSDAIELPETILERYIGVYEVESDFSITLTITITLEGSQLFAQVTGQEKSELYPENETKFFEPIDRYDLSFQIKERQVESLEIFQGGQKILAKKTN